MQRPISLACTVGLLLICAAPAAAQKAPEAQQPTLYEFNDTDIRLISAKIVDSLLATRDTTLKGKTAWLRLRNDTEERKLPLKPLMEAIETSLIKSGRFTVLRRTELETLAAEHGLELTAGASQVAVPLSRVAAVDYWMSGTISARANREKGREFMYYNFTVFLTDAKSTEKVWGESVEIKKARKLQLVEKAKIK